MASNKVEIIISARNMATGALKGVTGNVRGMATGSISAIKGLEARLRKGLGGAIKFVASRLTSLKTLAAGALAGWGLKTLYKNFIDAASTSENYRIRLKILLGSVKEGSRLFVEMGKYAAKVPFQYKEIMGSATALAGVMKNGVDDVVKWTPLIGDLAAASGLSFEETTSQVIRMYSAGAASADLFRERGILAMLGFQAGVSYSAEETRQKMFEAWESSESRFKGATRQMESSWKGLISMFQDFWFRMRNYVMDSGLFEYLKTGLQNTLDRIKKLEESGTLKAWAQKISDAVVSVIEKINDIGQAAWDFAVLAWDYAATAFGYIKNTVVPAVQSVVDVMQIWYYRNEDLIKQKMHTVLGWIGQNAKAVFDGVDKILKSGDLARWASGAVTSMTSLAESMSKVVGYMEKIEQFGKDVVGTYKEMMRHQTEQHKLAEKEDWDKLVEWEFTGKYNPTVPLGRAIRAVGELMDDLTSRVNAANPQYNIGFNSAAVQAAVNDYDTQITALQREIIQDRSDIENLRSYIGPNRPTFRDLANQELKEHMLQLNQMLQKRANLSGAAMAMASDGYSNETTTYGNSVEVGELHIHLPVGVESDQDWRDITRRYIVPELEALN